MRRKVWRYGSNKAAWGESGGTIGARGAVGGTGQTGQDTERGERTHWKGQTLGLLRMRGKSEHARCTVTGEDDDGTVLMFVRRTGQKTERRRATHLLERIEGGTGQDSQGMLTFIQTRCDSGHRTREKGVSP